MVLTVPLALPDEFVAKYALDLGVSSRWVHEHVSAAFGATGDMYVMSKVWRYMPDGEVAEDPVKQSVSAWLIARYAAGGGDVPAAFAVFLTPAVFSKFGDVSDLRMAVLPDGNLVLAGRPDITYLVAGDLSRVVGSYTTDPYRMPFQPYTVGNPFATHVQVTPGGRLLCTVAEFGVRGTSRIAPNLVAVADAALTAEHRPVLRAIAAMDAAPVKQDAELDVRPYVHFEGRPVGLDHRPGPGLGDQVDRLWPPRYSHGNHWLGHPVALADDRFVVPVFGRLFRGGNRGKQFAFVLMDDAGEVLGRLEGLDLYRDSPFTGECYRVSADPRSGRVFHLNRYGLYAWSADGTLLAKVATDTKPFTLLKNFTLLGCDPDGSLVLAQDKQNLLVRLPVPADGLAEGLARAVADGLAAFGKQRTALKKRWTPQEWHWTFRPEPGRLHHL
ncbi:hypothetical protein [Yinghuangia soli]|uniref:Uncharacterized protein n=1 Tax=Yinghuangia soli TaxID=2908204 RepID=A0AA41Q744_9ACTN|nr:hypothetical protein [Yinghuangia soli]MCF2532160.1 hypothetical protein [Yinghuangia soli]